MAKNDSFDNPTFSEQKPKKTLSKKAKFGYGVLIVFGISALSLFYGQTSSNLATTNAEKVTDKRDSRWHLCTVADAQYSRRNLASRQTGWAQNASDEVTFTGSKTVGWNAAANGSDFANLQSEFNWPWFCGPDSRTASGVGYQTINVDRIPLRFDAPGLEPTRLLPGPRT